MILKGKNLEIIGLVNFDAVLPSDSSCLRVQCFGFVGIGMASNIATW